VLQQKNIKKIKLDVLKDPEILAMGGDFSTS